MSKFVFVRRSIFSGNIPFWVIPFSEKKAKAGRKRGRSANTNYHQGTAAHRDFRKWERWKRKSEGECEKERKRDVNGGTVQDIHQQRVVSSTAKGMAASSTRSSSAWKGQRGERKHTAGQQERREWQREGSPSHTLQAAMQIDKHQKGVEPNCHSKRVGIKLVWSIMRDTG